MPNSIRPLDLRESAVMGRPLKGPIKEAVHFRIQDEFFGGIPRVAGDPWIQPRIVNFTWKRGDCSFKRKFEGLPRVLHRFFSLFFLSLKYCSNWSRRSFQNRSYSWTHPATSRSGSPRNDMKTSRPCFLRSISPALSRSFKCFVTAFKAVSNGFAISRNRAGPFASCPIIARRVGCEIAVRTSLKRSIDTLHHMV